MINEIEEFEAYTMPVTYSAKGKRDTTWLGRFTFDMLLTFVGFQRVLTIIARGYMFESDSPDIDRARCALCAWCSVPKAGFEGLHEEFPELIDEKGNSWLLRHVRNILKFVKSNPELISKPNLNNCALLKKRFKAEWPDKVVQLQVPIFTSTTKGSWTLRFDDILAEAKELGPLRNPDIQLSEAVKQKISAETPDGVRAEHMELLLKYYIANKPEDSEWVVLPVTNFDAYLGSVFSRKELNLLPPTLIERQTAYGVSRYKIPFSLS